MNKEDTITTPAKRSGPSPEQNNFYRDPTVPPPPANTTPVVPSVELEDLKSFIPGFSPIPFLDPLPENPPDRG